MFGPGGGDDAGVLLAHGAARWQLIAFAVPAVLVGLWLLDGLGPHFGLGPARTRVDRRAAVAAAAALAVLIVVELAFASGTDGPVGSQHAPDHGHQRGQDVEPQHDPPSQADDGPAGLHDGQHEQAHQQPDPGHARQGLRREPARDAAQEP